VGGFGSPKRGRLAVIDVTQPAAPVILSITELQGTSASSLAVGEDGSTLFIGTPEGVEIYNLTDPANPQFAGRLEGLVGDVALAEGVLVTASTEKGIQTAALANVVTIRDITPSAVIFEDGDPVTESDITISFSVIPSGIDISSAQVEIFKDSELVETLPAQVSGSDGVAVWPAGSPIDLKADYFARAVIEPGTQRELRSAPRLVPAVHLVFIDKSGEETFAPLTSNSRPVVTLEDVRPEDVTLLAGGEEALVTISGDVTDGIADIVANNVADIKEVRVEGQVLAVTPIAESPSIVRPHAFRGRFSGTVNIDVSDGGNTVIVETENSIGRKGIDSFTIEIEQQITPPDIIPTGNVFDTKFLDPFTLVTKPFSSTAPDSLILVHGSAPPTGSETPLVETGADTLTFVGITPELGLATLIVESEFLDNSSSIQEAIRARLSTTALALVDHVFEFVETTLDSGLFMSPARRLPSNEILAITLSQPLSELEKDTLRLGLESDTDQEDEVTETAPSSRVFVGQVAGLGGVTIRIREIQESPVGPDTMLVFFDSSELGLTNFHLALTEVATQAVGDRFETDVFGPSFVRVPASQSTTATLSRVENHASSDGGLFEPVWIVAKGLTSLGPGDHGQINSLPFELTVAPAPATSGATARSVVRFQEPVLFVRRTEQNQAPNVQPALEEADPEDPNQIASRHYNVFVNAQSQGLLARRSTGSASLSKLVGIRGRRMKLIHSFITIDPLANLLDSIDIPGATVVRQEQETETLPFGEGEVFRVKTTFSVEIGEKESPGRRNITFRLTDDTTKSFRDAFVISRGRMVIFAVDGLSFAQFNNVRQDGAPELREDRPGTALNLIFGEAREAQRQAIVRDLSTTFPPITYTRWASVFSGEPPGKHLAPSIAWFNRQALIGGSQAGAQPNQGLLKEDRDLVLDVHKNDKAYNRFFPVNFVYDNLRAEGFRSIVLNQQAGLGRGNRQVAPDDDIWRRITSELQIIEDARVALDEVREGGALEILDFFASMLSFVGSPRDLFDPDKFPRDARELLISDGMDREAIEWAIELIGQTGGEFDLMVIYLPGLDHAMHAFGPSGKRGEKWFQTGLLGVDERTSLHGRINRVFRALQEQDLADSTVFGVLSDHGHYDTDPEKFMDLDERGSLIAGNPPQFRSVLQVDENHIVGGVYSNSLAGRLFGRNANVIFDPQVGLAYIYVAGGIRSRSEFDWTKPPTVDALEPIVNAIFNSYIGPAGALRSWPDRAIADILVRVPANPDTFEGSEYKVVPRDYDPNRSDCGNGTERCGLAKQLAELETLRDKGIGEAPVSPWKYNDPERRIADLISANSGDVILLANAADGYQFGPSFKGNHGSLTEADSIVPVAFGYPGGTGNLDEDDTLRPVIEFLSEQQFPESPIQAIVEALAIEKFFGVERSEIAETEEP
jgi:hypothetical protein